MRKFIDITEGFQEASTRPKNRFSTNPKITIAVPTSVYKKISRWMAEYENVNVSVQDLMKNPKVIKMIENDIDTMYWDRFDEGFENMDLAAELGYESEIDDDDFELGYESEIDDDDFGGGPFPV